MSAWGVEFKPAARRGLSKLPPDAQKAIVKALDRLAFETGNPDEPRLSDLER